MSRTTMNFELDRLSQWRFQREQSLFWGIPDSHRFARNIRLAPFIQVRLLDFSFEIGVRAGIYR